MSHSNTTPDHLSSLIDQHVQAIQATYEALAVPSDQDFFLMGLRTKLQEVLPSAMGSPCIHKDIVDCIGRTKLVQLHKIQSALRENGSSTAQEEQESVGAAEVVAKLEFTNPGLSVKDRIAKSMLEAAEREGTIQPYVLCKTIHSKPTTTKNRHCRRKHSQVSPACSHTRTHTYTHTQFQFQFFLSFLSLGTFFF